MSEILCRPVLTILSFKFTDVKPWQTRAIDRRFVKLLNDISVQQ